MRNMRHKLDATLTETFRVVQAKMSSELREFEQRCQRDAMGLYLSQVRHTEELEAAELVNKFLTDESAYYQYLQARRLFFGVSVS